MIEADVNKETGEIIVNVKKGGAKKKKKADGKATPEATSEDAE